MTAAIIGQSMLAASTSPTGERPRTFRRSGGREQNRGTSRLGDLGRDLEPLGLDLLEQPLDLRLLDDPGTEMMD